MADKIIIFSGKQYSGKDTAAKIMLEQMPEYRRCAIGDIIKLTYGSEKGLTYEEIEKNKPKYRQDLINLGNWGRAQDPDYWLKKIIEQDGNIIVTDVRVGHEYEVFKNAGAITIRVEASRENRIRRGGELVGENDITEIGLDNIKDWDYIIDNNSDYDNLKKQGVNKIILLSHVGFGYDQRIARETDGIDIILGGHSHNLVEDVKPEYNLFYSKSGEPVVITQAGRDGRYFGILNVEFDPKGILTKIQNNVTSTRGFKRNVPARHVFEQIVGKPKIVGQIKSAPPPLVNDSIEPSGHANFMCDCMKEELGSDIALFGSATIRGYFEAGNLDTRWLEDISPFKNKMAVCDYSEKQIVDALRVSARSMVNTNNKPGILHVSGLKYTISKDGQLKSASFVNKEGKEIPIDINNPRTDKFYKTALTDYYCQGHDGFTMLKNYDNAQKYDFDITKCIEDYFKKHPDPVEIKDDGRIKIVD